MWVPRRSPIGISTLWQFIPIIHTARIFEVLSLGAAKTLILLGSTPAHET